jgi:uncharacterized membrane protein HdeD (DUF308 family)
MAGREHRRGMTDLAASTPRDPWLRSLTTLAATAGWALLVYGTLTVVVLVVTATQATWGGPVPWPILSGLAGLLACLAAGYAAGGLLPSRFTPPLTAIGVFMVMAVLTEAGLHGQTYGLLSPLFSAVQGVSVFYAPQPGLGLLQTVCFTGVALATSGAAGVRSGRARPLAIGVAGFVCVGAAAALAATGSIRDGSGVTIAALGDHSRTVPYTPVCTRGATIPVCLHPAYARTNELAALDHMVNTLAAPLAGTPGLPTRVQQLPPSDIPPPGTLAIEGFIIQGDTISPPRFASSLESRLALQLVTAPGTAIAEATPAQRTVATYLLDQAGDTPAPQLLLADPAITAAAQRLAALDPVARHAFLSTRLPAIRSGGLTLQDLP